MSHSEYEQAGRDDRTEEILADLRKLATQSSYEFDQLLEAAFPLELGTDLRGALNWLADRYERGEDLEDD